MAHVSISLHPCDVPGAQLYGQLVSDSLDSTLLQRVFQDAFDVSDWLHRTHPNPRVRYSTNDAGTAIVVTYRDKKLATIHVQE